MITRRAFSLNALAIAVAAMVLVPALAAQGERVPDSAVVNGVPQGIFVGRSLLTGRAVCLLFLSGGRITRAIPEGGLESFDWNRHRAAHGPDSGQWQIRGGQLVVAWGDGGVHQGPLTLHPDGIEFYGKRYFKPVAVSVAAIAGRWEAARGTAIVGGSGVNRISELVIDADGRYQWVTTVGGVVEGRAAAADRSMSGQVTITGATIVFRSDAGTTTSRTFLPAARSPVSAFSVDTDMFTRVGPAPVNAPASSDRTAPASPSAAGPAPAASYRGLFFTTPTGWTSGMQQGHFVLIPSNATADSVVIVVLSGADRLNGKSFDEWLRAKMAADLSGGLKVLQSAPPTRSKAGSFDALSAGRTVQDQSGGVLLQIYYAISDGQQAGTGMVATTSEAAMKTHQAGVQAIFQSLRFGTGADSAAVRGAARPSGPTANGGAGKATPAAADLVGSWSHASSAHTQYATASGGNVGSTTTAYGDGYTFKADGTFTYAFTGMMNSVYLRESDSGAWVLQGNSLVLRSRERNSTKTYQIVQFQASTEGTASMTLLLNSYPLTDSNINIWGERYVKKR